jgi:hypothetical protein
MFKIAPLSSSMMLVSMFGFIISAFFIAHENMNVVTWAWAFIIVFVLIFISTVISMSQSSLDHDFLDGLAIHEKDHYKKKK